MFRRLFFARCFDKLIGTRFKKNFDYTHIPLTEDTCIIIESGFLRRMDADYLERLKSSHSKKCLLLIDSMRGESPDLKLAEQRIFTTDWDQVYTIDKEDADKYQWNYIGLNYYSRPSVHKRVVNSDAYFVGGLKGNRDAVILQLFHKLKTESKPVFDLFCYSEKQYESREVTEGLNYSTEWKPYEKILKKAAAANCIVEILQQNQSCQSLRYFEAVALNKKLLTNNRNIIKLPFYDKRFMRCFENIDDIDVAWVKKRENINYHYNNEFSPVTFFEQIRGDVENQ